MTRREFIAVLAGAAVAWPLAARAEQPGVALIGLLAGAQLDDRMLSAVRQGLKEAGYVEGRNVAIKYRTADGRFNRLPGLATELVADPVAVILAFAPPAALAAKAASCNHSGRICHRRRSRRAWSRFQSQSTRWQCDGGDFSCHRPRGETVGVAA
jgi:ABC-type uncharacterized transport system substrate-binding protein